MTSLTTNGMTDREAAIDAVLRFVIGLDDADVDLVASAFTPDAVADVRGLSSIGIDYPELVGRDKVVSTLMNGVGVLDTTHQLGNFRVALNNDSAHLDCYVLAQHWRPGQGASPEHSAEFTMTNRYKVDLVRTSDGSWRMKKIIINCAWSKGDLGVLKHT